MGSIAWAPRTTASRGLTAVLTLMRVASSSLSAIPLIRQPSLSQIPFSIVSQLRDGFVRLIRFFRACTKCCNLLKGQ